jgi:hypothetical protein
MKTAIFSRVSAKTCLLVLPRLRGGAESGAASALQPRRPATRLSHHYGRKTPQRTEEGRRRKVLLLPFFLPSDDDDEVAEVVSEVIVID